MSSDNDDIVVTVALFFFGIWSFFRGFNRLRRKRLIENIPTSTVRGMAMGLVELCGKAENTIPLQSPLTKTDCSLYRYLVEEYRSSGRSGSWVTIAKGNSFYCPFWLDDGTGKVLVYAKGAELIIPESFTFKTGFNRDIPLSLIGFMEANAIQYKSWLGSKPLRFKEWVIRNGEQAYVLGTAQKSQSDTGNFKISLMQRIEELKINPEKMKAVDLNKDGNISNEEWDAAVNAIEEKLLQETLAAVPADNPADVVITKGAEERVFIISDYSQEALGKKLSGGAALGIYGGAALTLAMLAYLLLRFRIF
jgi:hypothetical protein